MDLARADAFGRLRRLIGDAHPATGVDPVLLHLGEQRLSVPTELLQALETGEAWSFYPPLGGSQELRNAYVEWLERRFQLRAERIACEPIPGSKQGVATAIQLAVDRRRQASGAAVSVLVPDLCYPTYRAAAATAGAEVVTYDPDRPRAADAITAALARSSAQLAAIVVCNPGNPTGSVMAKAELSAVAELAGSRAATLIVDECYVDLWLSRPIEGALQLAADCALPCPLLVLHTLSKRSGAPGLRSGFVAGDPATIADYAQFNRSCGVSLSRPVCATSAALWRDDQHVERLRAALLEAWCTADTLLGKLPGYRRPEAGFFLWLPVDDGEAAALALWREAAVLSMPGVYLADGPRAHDGDAQSTARRRIRLALVHPPAVLAPALARLRAVLAARPVPAMERESWNPTFRSAS